VADFSKNSKQHFNFWGEVYAEKSKPYTRENILTVCILNVMKTVIFPSAKFVAGIELGKASTGSPFIPILQNSIEGL
jgi:hypothetical protein